MNKIQIKKYKELSALKEQYEKFIARDGNVSIAFCSHVLPFPEILCEMVEDDEFKDLVKNIAKERLKNINKQIEEL